MANVLFEDGHSAGPLFELMKKRGLIRTPGNQGKIHRQQTNRATPRWLTDEQKAEIRLMYKKAKYLTKKTGELYVVDHVVPKIGKIVCGLHVPWNLEVIHWLDNAQKGAWVWPDMPMCQMELF